MRVAVVIPALDEQGAIGGVVAGFVGILRADGERLAEEIVVADNGSRDRTAEVARAAGATVVQAPVRGYGSACLAAIDYLRKRMIGPPDIVVFADGDGANDPAEMNDLLAPIVAGRADMVIGSRVRRMDPGSETVPQKFGNILATRMLGLLYGVEVSDLGPYRAIRWSAYERLGMIDPNYGWTVEMQIKAAKLGLVVVEVDVANRRRVAGSSKVGGTVRGVIGAGYKIISLIVKYY